MGGEKTWWLIRQFAPGKTMVFIPQLDHRSGTQLKAHNGQSLSTNVYVVQQYKPQQILVTLEESNGNKPQRILIDEVNFFSLDLVEVIQSIRKKGVDVYAAGLLLDSDLNDFGPTRQLARLANRANAQFAHCDYVVGSTTCKHQAVFNYFKGYKPDQVVVGAFDLYGCACPEHMEYFRHKYHSPKLNVNIDPTVVWQV